LEEFDMVSKTRIVAIKIGDSCVYDSSGYVTGKPDNTLSAGYFSSFVP
jgi:hypothetical protein